MLSDTFPILILVYLPAKLLSVKSETLRYTEGSITESNFKSSIDSLYRIDGYYKNIARG